MPTLLVILRFLWGALLFGGFILGPKDETRRMPLWTRLASSFTLVVAAWCWYWLSPTQSQLFALWLALGMTLGFVGDIFMAGVGPIPRSVIGGMGAFGLGHLCYIVGIVGIGAQFGWDDSGARWGAWGAWLLIGAIGWYGVVLFQHEATLLHWVALPYALLLASTTGLATGLAIQNSAFVPMALGAALFLLSDLLIAAQLFNQAHFWLIGDVIWLTYGSGQMLIIYSVFVLW